MGLFDKLKGEFIDVIEWLDNTQDSICYRFERYGNEIKNGAQLTVRPGQLAVFVNEGKAIADAFEPGRHTLSTQNLPIMTTLNNWKMGFNSPFKAEVYFFNMVEHMGMKWGTKNPIRVAIPGLPGFEMNGAQMRAFGTYNIQITDPKLFLEKVVSTDGDFTKAELDERIKTDIISSFSNVLGGAQIPFLQLASNLEGLSGAITEKISKKFEAKGFVISQFLIENLSMPPEVEQALNQAAQNANAKFNEFSANKAIINQLGGMDQFMQYNLADSLNNTDGNGGTGMDAAMNMMAMNMLKQNMGGNTQNINQTPPPLVTQYFVAVNGQQTGPFEYNILQQMTQQGQLTQQTMVWKQGMAAWSAAGQVQELAALFASLPPPIPM